MKADLLKDLYSRDDGMPESLRSLLQEQKLSLPDGIYYLLNRIFMSEVDALAPEEFESYTQRLVSASLQKGDSLAGHPAVNTYPFGVKTTEVFPEFLGICADDKNLRSVLKIIGGQCRKMSQMFPVQQEKTVVLLTDKWDEVVFKKQFELDFLHYALNYNVLFAFLLVTDYGVTRIPFLAQNRARLEILCQRGYDIEREDAGVEALKLLNQFSSCFYKYRSGTWTAPGSSGYCNDSYLFDFKAGICEITNAFGEVGRKKIPKFSAQRFAQAVYKLFGQPQQEYVEQPKMLDAGTCEAEVFGLRFEWTGVGDDSLSDPSIRIVSRAFTKLIASLEEI